MNVTYSTARYIAVLTSVSLHRMILSPEIKEQLKVPAQVTSDC